MSAAENAFYNRAFWLVVAALVAYGSLRIFAPLAGALTWAVFLAFVLYPLNLRLRRRVRANAGLAAAILTLITPFVVLLPLIALTIDFAAQASLLVVKLQSSAQKFDVHTLNDVAQFPWVARASTWLQSHGSLSGDQIQAGLLSGLRESLQRTAQIGGTLFLGTLSTSVSFLLMLFLLFFFLRDGDSIVLHARRLIPLGEIRKERLLVQLSDLTRAIVFGTAVTALAQGFLVGVGFAIAGLPSPVVFGVAAALLSLLPVGGTALIWAPAAIWLCIDHRWGYGIFLFIWGAVLSGLDNVLRPLLISGRAPISTLVVFLGVLGGISAFGPIGVIAGPLLLSLALALLAILEESAT